MLNMKIKKRSLKIAGLVVLAVLIIAGIVAFANMEKGNKIVVLETNKGDITIELFSDMPITTSNFENLINRGFYDRSVFHRVIPGFMIQGGDPTGLGIGGPGYAIKDEFNPKYSNVRGTIAMANSGPNTGGSQFFINIGDNKYLDSKHPVFGKVISGMEVVDAISLVERNPRDRPVEDVVIIRAYLK